MTRGFIRTEVEKFSKMTILELEAYISDPSAESMKVALARICYQTALTGDTTKLDMLLNRSIGKVKDQLELKQTGPTPEEKRRIAQAIFSDPQSLAAAEVLAAKVSEQKLLGDGTEDEGDDRPSD